jgi:hypothetical protein
MRGRKNLALVSYATVLQRGRRIKKQVKIRKLLTSRSLVSHFDDYWFHYLKRIVMSCNDKSIWNEFERRWRFHRDEMQRSILEPY